MNERVESGMSNDMTLGEDGDASDPGNRGSGFVMPNGKRYLGFLSELHEKHLFDWYLEAGTCKGHSLVPPRSKSIAVDPFFRVDVNVIGTKPQMHAFQMGTDEFFDTGFLKANKIKLDLAFLDGMHLFEYLLRDFINTEKNAKTTSVVVMHDCCPFSYEMTTRDLDNMPSGAWTGDVWKLIPILKEFRPDLTVTVMDARPTGLVVVTGLDPASKKLAANYDKIVAQYRDLTLEEYGLEKFYSLFTFARAADEALNGFPLFAPASIDPELALQPHKVST